MSGDGWSGHSSSRGSFANFFWFIVFIVIGVLLFRSCTARNRERPYELSCLLAFSTVLLYICCLTLAILRASLCCAMLC